jgi:hypothetical protein
MTPSAVPRDRCAAPSSEAIFPISSRTKYMSHLVTIVSKVRDHTAIVAACRRNGLAEPSTGTARLFSGEASGLLLRLPGWEYPAVIDTTSGEIKYDNYNGAWGSLDHLDRFLQAYAVEVAKLEARKNGHLVAEQRISDGSIKLTIQVG